MRWAGILLLLASQAALGQTPQAWEMAAKDAVIKGQWRRVLDAVTERRGLEPPDLLAEWLAAHALVSTGDYASATGAFRRLGEAGSGRRLQAWTESLLAEKGESAGAMFLLGDALARDGHEQESISALNRAVELAPRWALAFNARGAVQALIGRLEEAAADFTTAATLDVAFADAYANRGLIRLAQGTPGNAVEDLTLALEKAGRHPVAQHARGVAYLQLGEWERAREDLESPETELAGLAWAQNNRRKAAAARLNQELQAGAGAQEASGVLSFQSGGGNRPIAGEQTSHAMPNLASLMHTAIARSMDSIASDANWLKPVAELVAPDAKWGIWSFQAGMRFQAAGHVDKIYGITNPALSHRWEEVGKSGIEAMGTLLKPTEIGKQLFLLDRSDNRGELKFFDKPIHGMTSRTAAVSLLDGAPKFAEAFGSQLGRGSWTPTIKEVDLYAEGVTKASSALLGKVAFVEAYNFTFPRAFVTTGGNAVAAHRIAASAAKATDHFVTEGLRAGSKWASEQLSEQPWLNRMFMGGVRSSMEDSWRVVVTASAARNLPKPTLQQMYTQQDLDAAGFTRDRIDSLHRQMGISPISTGQAALFGMGRCPGGTPPPCGGGGGGGWGGAAVSPTMPKAPAAPKTPNMTSLPQTRMSLPKIWTPPSLDMVKPKGVLMGAQVVHRPQADFSAMLGSAPPAKAGEGEAESFYIPFLLFSGRERER